MNHRVLIAVALAFTIFFAILTISVIVHSGLDILTLTSLVVLTLLGIGLAGALTQPPEQ